MKKEEKIYKPFSIWSFVVYSVIILYFGIQIGDKVNMISSDDLSLFTRYIPMIFLASLGTYFVVKTLAKKEYKSEEEKVKEKMIFGPIIVAIILLIYGLYSVHQNIKMIEEEFSYSLSAKTSQKNKLLQEEFDRQLNEAKSEAIMNWITTTIIYIVFAETTNALIGTKVNMWLLEGSPETVQYEKTVRNAFFEEEKKPKDDKEKEVEAEQEEIKGKEEKKPKRLYTDPITPEDSENNIKDTMKGIKWNL